MKGGGCGAIEALIREVLSAECGDDEEERPWSGAPSMAIVVAHPDDETVGLGAHLHHLREAAFLYLTDGAPRDMKDAALLGFANPEEYANARESERRAAFRTAGIDRAPVRRLGFADQECVHHLVEISSATAEFFRSCSTDVVFTHPYEGGHPDHDACAFAVRSACRMLEKAGERPPAVIEMASYHARNGRMEPGCFLPQPGLPALDIELDEEARSRKRRLFACYRTQERILNLMDHGVECFRRAPGYSFGDPPHMGDLLYETFGISGVSGQVWRELAGRAEVDLRHGGRHIGTGSAHSIEVGAP